MHLNFATGKLLGTRTIKYIHVNALTWAKLYEMSVSSSYYVLEISIFNAFKQQIVKTTIRLLVKMFKVAISRLLSPETPSHWEEE